MQILRGLHSPDHQPVVLTIGNFDGVHLGHQAVLARLRQIAEARGGKTAAVIFEPQPREFFTPDTAPARLTSLREKLEVFASLGVDRVHVCRFNRQLAQMGAGDFIQTLHDAVGARYVLIGDDFRFGSGRTGDFAMMEKIGERVGFEVAAMHSVLHDGLRVSSTAVRLALARGDLGLAQRYLGRAYSISGRVVHGDGIGKRLGYPTANIKMQHNRPPFSGVFVVQARLPDGRRIDGVASLGVRPTVNNEGRLVLEAHLFGFAEDLYGAHLHLDFLHKLRDEAKFPDFESLTRQIALDVERAQHWFRQHHG